MARSPRCAALGAPLLLLSLAIAAPAGALQARRAGRIDAPPRAYTLAAEADRVEALPGAPSPQAFGMFAGNITVDAAAGRGLFYVFVERATAPESAPVILWLNGGPGCSSLGGGFMSELGPYFPHQKGNALKDNPYAWNNGLANVIFLESPAFVGFSFSDTPSDAIVGDKRTAVDARRFLLGWLERFPQYADSDLFLSGESYGGHYVPNLALEIVRGNKRAAAAVAAAAAGGAAGEAEGRDRAIPLKGFLVGNANIGPLSRGKHALALGRAAGRRPGRANPAALAAAAGDGAAGAAAAAEALQKAADEKCDAAVQLAFDEITLINIYDIYADTCHPDPPPEPPVAAAAAAAAAAAPGRHRGALLGDDPPPPPRPAAPRGGGAAAAPAAPSPWSSLFGPLFGGGGGDGRRVGYPQPGRVPRYDPCIDNKVDVYMNKPEVQAALHANQTGALPGPWQDCTSAISYSRADLLTSMLPVYEELLKDGGLQIWVFSGDVDGIVPVLGSRRWVSGLGLDVTAPWRAWQSQTGQVAGWRVDYEGLSFVTVRNAGHMVRAASPPAAAMRRATALLLAAAALLAAAHVADAARMGALSYNGYQRNMRDGKLRVLAIGDSITQGAVPSANENHPYTIALEERLRADLGRKVDVDNGGVRRSRGAGAAGAGGGGGRGRGRFPGPPNRLLAKKNYDWAVVMVGINDLLRVGKPADEVMKGLLDIYRPALEAGTNVLAIAPLAAPGFVSRDDYKEGERIKLADAIQKAGDWWNEKHPEGPTFLVANLGVNGPMDFWKMDEAERAQWLDDGLHLKRAAYDRMGGLIADLLLPKIRKAA
ncbi:MAG: serine carboxypeptidase-domain-containing protein [Monoraphidium minutum]|nr:MAG: serine carboxypeptidase-domain-containing protein [Monoraphidium minutum]